MYFAIYDIRRIVGKHTHTHTHGLLNKPQLINRVQTVL